MAAATSIANPPHHVEDVQALTPPTLGDLPAEVIERIITLVAHARDLAAANATSRLFRGVPGSRSPVEQALRERARARDHDRTLPNVRPPSVLTWTEELFARERVLELARVHGAAVACAHEFSAFVDADGRLHTCGEQEATDENMLEEVWWNVAFSLPNALGHPKVMPVLVPTHVASLSAVRVCAVAAGREHLLALSDAGVVYACGENWCGQLGLGEPRELDENASCDSFAALGTLSGEFVVHIAAGGGFSCAVGVAGAVYSWGRNDCGQLGHGHTDGLWRPRRIEALAGVRVGAASMGVAHALLLSTDGATYSCGYGGQGQLGHGNKHDQHTPRRVEALSGEERAVHVSAGSSHSLVVDAAGRVHSFGANLNGCLGCDSLSHRQLVPRCIEALADVRSVRACASFASSAVVGADGSVHTFGDNSCGQLGLGYMGVREVPPAHVEGLADERVVDCSLSGTLALFVTADGCVYSCGKHAAALGHGTSAFAGNEYLVLPKRISQLPPLSR